MGNYTLTIDSATVTASGGTQTGTRISVDNRDTIAVQLEGDANSTNLDLELQGKNGGQATTTWGDVDTTTYTGEDITVNTNNSKIYMFDVSGLAEIRPLVRNNAASDTVITASIGVDTNN